MTAKTMAAVLADHYVNYQWHRDLSENLWTCTSLDCSFTSGGFEQAIAHQAAALSAAGFGLVADAKAEAWDEAYKLGVDDERTSQANPGIAGCFCHGTPCQCFVAPARVNPYRAAS